MIGEPFVAKQAVPAGVPLNLDLDVLPTDYDYAKRAKDKTNYERVHARNYQVKKYIP